MTTIYEQMKKAGVTTDHHSSDLYVPVNRTTEKIIKDYKNRGTVTKFRSAIDGTLWYDIPFAFDPWFKSRMQDR